MEHIKYESTYSQYYDDRHHNQKRNLQCHPFLIFDIVYLFVRVYINKYEEVFRATIEWIRSVKSRDSEVEKGYTRLLHHLYES